jgi:hypothetical protein
MILSSLLMLALLGIPQPYDECTTDSECMALCIEQSGRGCENLYETEGDNDDLFCQKHQTGHHG